MGREGRNNAVEIARQEKNRWKKRALNAEATLGRVREWVEDPSKHQGDDYDKGLGIAEVILRAILDESPTERETPADREDVARVLRDADRPDVPAHLPPSRSYARMAAALMERFTITDGAHSSSVSITSPEVATSDAVSGETPADEWEYGRAGRFVDDGTDARDDYWYGPRGAAEANISLLNEKEGVEPFDTRIEYRLVRRLKAGPREEVPDDRA